MLPVFPTQHPLCVDLDGTLVRSDLLIEAAFGLLRQNALYAFRLPFWLARGKAHLKQQIAERVDIDVTLLPYNLPLLDYLRQEQANGRRLVLATASNVRYAEQVSTHLGIFDEVLASDAETNLSGARKRDRLVAAFGPRGFAHAADDVDDLPVWEQAREAVLVDAPSRVSAGLPARTPVARVFTSPRADVKVWFKAIRLHQWLKNVLVFVPVLTAHRW